MPITVTLSGPSTLSIDDLFGAIDFLAFEGNVTRFTTTFFGLTGSYDGSSASASVNGSGFGLGSANGQTYVTSGLIDLIVFSAGGSTIRFEDVDIDLAELSPLIIAEDAGTNVLGVENFLMDRDWDITLGDANDVASRALSVGDGAAFNLRGNDTIRAGGGRDNIYGGHGHDTLLGEEGNDRLDGGAGRDRLDGGIGRDTLLGGGGGDTLLGGAGNDRLFGGAGRDILEGGAGRDLLVGGAGPDVFVFGNNGGTDRVRGFDADNNREDIDLSGVSAIVNYRDLMRNHADQVDGDVVIDDHAGTRIILLGVDIDDLGAVDFRF